MTAATAASSDDLREQLLADHIRLAELCERVQTVFDADDRDGCDAIYRELEQGLEAHLAFEESELLPALAKVHPAEAAALADDHRRIRGRMTELGIGVDLHVTRATAVRELIAELGDHARREGALLYQWANESFEEPTRRRWLDMLRSR